MGLHFTCGALYLTKPLDFTQLPGYQPYRQAGNQLFGMEGSTQIVPAGVPVSVDTAEQQKKNNGVDVIPVTDYSDTPREVRALSPGALHLQGSSDPKLIGVADPVLLMRAREHATGGTTVETVPLEVIDHEQQNNIA